MAQFAAELFVQCVYSLELSYDDLLQTEAELKLAMTAILEDSGGSFIHFEEMGDIMRSQCVFSTYEESLFHNICDRFAPLMNGQVEARLLFVDKDLDTLHFYVVNQGQWKESCLRMPAAGPLTLALREVDPFA